jgi:recombination protein RecT
MAEPDIIEPRKTGTAIANWQEFETTLAERQAEIGAMLPANIPLAKFQATAIAAVKQNPDLLLCTARSLMSAVTKSAQDGILPDGREGVINSYNTKVSKRGEPDRWEKQAQWNPMAHGLRKRAREIDGILIDAQVVYQNDTLIWEQGDRPRIEHTPAPLGTPRGEKIGAYAIFKREDGTILAREVMAKDEITKVREQSKAPDSLMWTKFEGEGWRKTVLRRGIKSVPVSEEFESIVRRDDENFSFPQGQDAALPGEVIPPRPARSDFEREPDPKPTDKPAPQAQTKPAAAKPEPEIAKPEPVKETAHVQDQPADAEHDDAPVVDPAAERKAREQAEFDSWYEDQKTDLPSIKKLTDVSEFRDVVAEQLEGDPRLAEWNELCAARLKAIMDATRKAGRK